MAPRHTKYDDLQTQDGRTLTDADGPTGEAATDYKRLFRPALARQPDGKHQQGTIDHDALMRRHANEEEELRLMLTSEWDC